MNILTIKFYIALFFMVALSNSAFSQDVVLDIESDELSTPEKKSTSTFQPIRKRLRGFFHTHSYRASYGFGSLKILNPEGFDIDSSTYVDGFSNANSTPRFLTLVGEQPIGWEGRLKSLWGLHYDNEDYSGLELRTLVANAGVAVGTSIVSSVHVRLAAGLGVGLTRSESFFDSAIHPAGEAWASTGIQLGRFTIDFTIRARQALSADLDERTADPKTVARELSFGWVF